jgi:transcriptional regulator with XRE-family HTH domain
MGYGGRVADRERARELREQAWTLAEIAREIGASKSSVSVWCRDVVFEPRPRNRGHAAGRKPHPLHLARLAELDRCRVDAVASVGALSDRDLFIAGIALYAGEGAKTGSSVVFANTDPRMVALFLRWLRSFFTVDEERLRVRVYLHEGLDIEAANSYWSGLTGIPVEQFGKPYRAIADPSRRAAKHRFGCPSVRYSCVSTLRQVLALSDALLGSCPDFPG